MLTYNVMRQHATSISVSRKGCRAIANLAMREPLRSDLVVAIPSVLRAMSDHPHDAALQESGLRLLSDLALRDPQAQKVILRHHGAPLIANAEALLELSDAPKPFRQIAQLIALVAVDEDSAEVFRRDTTLTGLMSGMEHVMHEPDSLYYTMKAISNICGRAETSEYDLPPRLLDLVLRAMRAYPQDVELLGPGLDVIIGMAPTAVGRMFFSRVFCE